MKIKLRKSIYRTRCQFSKKTIYPDNYIAYFDKKQYKYFNKTIYEILNPFLPDEIINIIIEKTNYKKYINHWGLVLYVDWIQNTYFESRLSSKLESNQNSDSDNNDF